MESAQLTGDQKAELLRQRREYLDTRAQLARARAPYEVSKHTVLTMTADMVVLWPMLSARGTVTPQWQLCTRRCCCLFSFQLPAQRAADVCFCVQQAQLPDSDGTAGGDVASCSCLDAAAALPHIATSVVKIGSLLQQEQALFLRVGSICFLANGPATLGS